MKKTDKSNGWVDEFDIFFVGKVQVKSDTTAVKYETNHMWKEDECGGYETMIQPYQVKEYIQQLLNKAIREERNRFVEMIGEVEAIPTHINNHVIDRNNPFLNWCKGKNKLRQELKTKLTKDN